LGRVRASNSSFISRPAISRSAARAGLRTRLPHAPALVGDAGPQPSAQQPRRHPPPECNCRSAPTAFVVVMLDGAFAAALVGFLAMHAQLIAHGCTTIGGRGGVLAHALALACGGFLGFGAAVGGGLQLGLGDLVPWLRLQSWPVQAHACAPDQEGSWPARARPRPNGPNGPNGSQRAPPGPAQRCTRRNGRRRGRTTGGCGATGKRSWGAGEGANNTLTMALWFKGGTDLGKVWRTESGLGSSRRQALFLQLLVGWLLRLASPERVRDRGRRPATSRRPPGPARRSPLSDRGPPAWLRRNSWRASDTT
jgi:hypothetical protein